MTYAEWLAATSPTPMLAFIREKASDRKLRLFAVACCRRLWQLLDEDVSRPAVDVIERFADGLATPNDLESAQRAARSQGKDFEKICAWRRNTRGPSPEADLYQSESEKAYLVSYACQKEDYLWWVLAFATRCKLHVPVGIRRDRDSHTEGLWDRLYAAGEAELADLLRDIFNPFAPPLERDWRTTTVLTLATGVYDEKAFERLPILADSLQDAGCDSVELLNHLRQPGDHWRGCWALDLVLGKK